MIEGGRLTRDLAVVKEGELVSRNGGFEAKQGGLIRETDAGEGATRAFGGVDEGRRDDRGAGGGPGGGNLILGFGEQLRGK